MRAWVLTVGSLAAEPTPVTQSPLSWLSHVGLWWCCDRRCALPGWSQLGQCASLRNAPPSLITYLANPLTSFRSLLNYINLLLRGEETVNFIVAVGFISLTAYRHLKKNKFSLQHYLQ